MCARNFSIAIHDPESQLLTFPYFVDEQESAPAPAKPGRSLADYVLRTGEVSLAGSAAELKADYEKVAAAYLGARP